MEHEITTTQEKFNKAFEDWKESKTFKNEITSQHKMELFAKLFL